MTPSPFATGINDRGSLAAAFRSPAEGATSMTALRLDAAIRQIVGSYKAFTLINYEDDTLYAVGGGVNGEMGQGDHRDHYLPVKVNLLPPVAEVDADGAHWIARLRDGRVATCGGNSWGTKGDGTSGFGQEKAGTAIPYIVPGITDAVEVSTGAGVSAVRHEDGTVSAWGTCPGDGKVYDPIKVVPFPAPGCKPQKVPGLSGVTKISAGGFGANNHVLVIAQGTAFQWGAKGPCGAPADILTPTALAIENPVDVEAGAGESFVIDSEANLIAWGSNTDEQLWLPATVNHVPFAAAQVVRKGVAEVSAGFQFAVCRGLEGTVSATGRNDQHQCGLDGLTAAEYVYAGMFGAYVLAEHAAILPPIAAFPSGSGKAVVRWTAGATSKPWLVSTRTMNTAKVFGPAEKLPSTAREATIPLTEPTEIRVVNGPTWPTRFAEVVPA